MDEVTQVWPDWHIVEKIGQGGFGCVYKVCNNNIGNSYYAAVKVIEYPNDKAEIIELRNSNMDEASIYSYFRENLQGIINEIQVMESLKSAGNIVSIEDYKLVQRTDIFGWKLYIRMELLKSLNIYLSEKGKMNQDEVVKLGIDMCKALSCCEKKNTIHRDIKPDNIFVNEFGDFKLGDFGISKQMENTSSLKSQKGTLMYMAPEIYRGESYGNTVDIYALGITMYKLLNDNRGPYMPRAPQVIRPGDAEKANTARITGCLMPNPANCDVPLANIIKKACEFSPFNRYSNADALRVELEKWQQNKNYYKAATNGIYENTVVMGNTMQMNPNISMPNAMQMNPNISMSNAMQMNPNISMSNAMQMNPNISMPNVMQMNQNISMSNSPQISMPRNVKKKKSGIKIASIIIVFVILAAVGIYEGVTTGKKYKSENAGSASNTENTGNTDDIENDAVSDDNSNKASRKKDVDFSVEDAKQIIGNVDGNIYRNSFFDVSVKAPGNDWKWMEVEAIRSSTDEKVYQDIIDAGYENLNDSGIIYMGMLENESTYSKIQLFTCNIKNVVGDTDEEIFAYNVGVDVGAVSKIEINNQEWCKCQYGSGDSSLNFYGRVMDGIIFYVVFPISDDYFYDIVGTNR